MDVLSYVPNLFLQVGTVFAGAASFWGIYFAFQAHREPEAAPHWVRFSKLLYPVFVFGVLLAAAGWIMSAEKNDAQLVVGIIILIATLIGGFFVEGKRATAATTEAFYFFAFLAMVAFAVIPVVDVHILVEFLTLGTIGALGYVALFARKVTTQRALLVDRLPFLASVVWVGLAIEFIAAFDVVQNEFIVSNVFIFVELMFGIIVLLAVVFQLFAKRIANTSLGDVDTSFFMLNVSSLFVTFFMVRVARAYDVLPLSVGQMFVTYLALLVIVFVSVVIHFELRKSV